MGTHHDDERGDTTPEKVDDMEFDEFINFCMRKHWRRFRATEDVWSELLTCDERRQAVMTRVFEKMVAGKYSRYEISNMFPALVRQAYSEEERQKLTITVPETALRLMGHADSAKYEADDRIAKEVNEKASLLSEATLNAARTAIYGTVGFSEVAISTGDENIGLDDAVDALINYDDEGDLVNDGARSLISIAMKPLSDVEKAVIELYYLRDDIDETDTAIAEALDGRFKGVSRASVQRHRTSALSKMWSVLVGVVRAADAPSE